MTVALEKLKIGFVLTIITLILNNIYSKVYDIDSFTGIIGSFILAVGIFYIIGLLASKLVKSNKELW